MKMLVLLQYYVRYIFFESISCWLKMLALFLILCRPERLIGERYLTRCLAGINHNISIFCPHVLFAQVIWLRFSASVNNALQIIPSELR